ncbi:MAG: 23S rRNA (uracil(1939)-C(5))-methyltransferase RlmD [Bacteroides sp.]|nr:23S rRNA (uracil(1939)-C(5))-methyltransferase RlmD [Roseburia sp.]MCM1345666.1 23S rRNA (uracil(1939)-C(5))-methyltransferase RlmD [Bacteroides sp.]MCM1419901.1 23S rRNA (uracil(1939)-C(5))-methyltransferase RlmD [Bacteroides sp.]
MRKKKTLPLLENVTITAVAAEGKALARVDDKVVFVPFVVPGDVVDLQVKRKKNSYMEAVAVAVHKESSLRAVPFCEHYGVCGGCKWQCLKYEEQLKAKQQQVVDNLVRIGKVELPDISPIIGSEKTRCYRNKLEFGFSDKRWLTEEEVSHDVKYEQMNAVGFHITGAFDKILDINKCWLMDDVCNRIRNDIREYALANGLVFYNLRNNTGLLRSMMIRNSNTGELMLLVQFRIENEDERKQAEDLMQHIADTFPEITSLLYVDNHKCNDTFGDQEVVVFKGEDHIYEEMEGLRFKVGPKSFYQTNTEQAYNLYKVARDFAGLTGNELVYDLYTGTGTIANFVARSARKVIGIEYVPEAIEDAKVNSQINGIDNTLFYAGDMKDILNRDFIEEHGCPDVIITDPPRAGMHQDVVDTILFAAPKRIVYVSCNPATQARDLLLLDGAYRVVAVQPVDMFPHTQHVENVVLLERRNDAV